MKRLDVGEAGVPGIALGMSVVVVAVVAFFLAYRGFLGKVRRIIFRLHFLKVKISLRVQFHFSDKDRSTVAHQAEMTVDERDLTSCV